MQASDDEDIVALPKSFKSVSLVFGGFKRHEKIEFFVFGSQSTQVQNALDVGGQASQVKNLVLLTPKRLSMDLIIHIFKSAVAFLL